MRQARIGRWARRSVLPAGLWLAALAGGCSGPPTGRLAAGSPVVVHDERWGFAIAVCDDGPRKLQVQVPAGTRAVVRADDGEPSAPDRAVRVSFRDGPKEREGVLGRRYLRPAGEDEAGRP